MKKFCMYCKDLHQRLKRGEYKAECTSALLLQYISRRFIYTLFFLMGATAMYYKYYFNGIAILILSAILYRSKKLISDEIRLCYIIVRRIYGRYGKVITRNDWKNIRNKDFKLYLKSNSFMTHGRCYYYPRHIAKYIDGAKIMFCGVKGYHNNMTAHVVIVKDGDVYDTSKRRHYSYEDYLKYFEAKPYRFFSKTEYQDENFLFNIVDGFSDWCKRNGVEELLSAIKKEA